MLPESPATPLAPREQHFRIPGPLPGRHLFLRRLRAGPEAVRPPGAPVLYVHGATFPSALSIAHRFDGYAWRDALCAAGHDVWALDFHGFGVLSDPLPELAEPAEANPPAGRAEAASLQLEAAVRFVSRRHGNRPVSLIAHSWGTMVAGRLAGRCPELVDRLLLFGPITRRDGAPAPQPLPAWRLVTLRDQWERFVADTPEGEAPVLLERHFRLWGERYLDCDAESRTRTPPAVKVPCGPMQDILDAWAGRLAWDPGLVRTPVCIVRGAWDSLCTDADARWLLGALSAAPVTRDIRIERGGHLLHLEEGRHALHAASLAFLGENAAAPGRPGIHAA